MEKQRPEFSSYRWFICALILFATTVNYLDRSVISLLKSTLSEELNWDDGDYADIEIAFKLTYAVGMLLAGRVIDKVGSKMGYFVAAFTWSLAAVAHAFASSTLGFLFARAALGLSESGNFPAAIKSTAEWFPKKERALATGIFNAGANIGPLIAPFIVLPILSSYGWEWTFIITGSIGFVWLIFWMVMYRNPADHPRVSQKELDYINSDVDEVSQTPTQKVSWARLLKFRQTWAFVFGKFLTDPIWWFYIFWLPDFLQSEYKLSLAELVWPTGVVYFISFFGSIFGGWLPFQFMQSGWPSFRSRKTAMFIYALLVLPIMFSQVAGKVNMWFAVGIIGIAMAAHQAWSANIFTTVSDMFPKKAIASVTGIGGMFGGLGGIVFSFFVQKDLFVHYRAIGDIETAYYIMFFICSGAYLVAWTIMHFLVPRMQRVNI